MTRRSALTSSLFASAALAAVASTATSSLAQTAPDPAVQQARLKLDCFVHAGFRPIERFASLRATAPTKLPGAGGTFPLSWELHAKQPLRHVKVTLTDLTLYNHPNRFGQRKFRYARVSGTKADSTVWKVPAATRAGARESLRFQVIWASKKYGPDDHAIMECDAAVPFSS